MISVSRALSDFFFRIDTLCALWYVFFRSALNIFERQARVWALNYIHSEHLWHSSPVKTFGDICNVGTRDKALRIRAVYYTHVYNYVVG